MVVEVRDLVWLGDRERLGMGCGWVGGDRSPYPALIKLVRKCLASCEPA